jgi:flagellar biogenesis protein FliO
VIFSYLLTLFGVCGLAVGALVVLRSLNGGGLVLGHAQPIRVVGRQAVGTGSTLMLVEVDGARMLIGVSRAGIAVLEASPPDVSKVVPIENGFRAVIKRAGERW